MLFFTLLHSQSAQHLTRFQLQIDNPNSSLETYLTAATLTSIKSVTSHHKLFSSSAEVHHAASENLPEKLQALTIDDALQSVERVVKDTCQKGFRPSDRFGRFSVRGFEKAKVPSLVPAFSTDTPPASKHDLDKSHQLQLLSQCLEDYHHQIFDESFGRQTEDEQCSVLDEVTAFAKKGWNIVGRSVERQREREQKAVYRERLKVASSIECSPVQAGRLQEQ